MAADKEQQARVHFLAEAESYFGQVETAVLNLRTAADRVEQINIAMRAAHSVKGTAGMMSFNELSRVAHKLEDCFKILQARQLGMDTALETLLLQGVDCMRTLRQSYYQGEPLAADWFTVQVEPIFAQLSQGLGELTPEDEARLLSEEADENLDFVIFNTSVEDCLDEFEQTVEQLRGDELKQALVALARRLADFGLMAQLDAFVSFCRSVQQQATFASTEAIEELAKQALKEWKRSHSLVLLGRLDRLPTQLGNPLEEEPATAPIAPVATAESAATDASDVSQLQEQLAALQPSEMPMPVAEPVLQADSPDSLADIELLRAGLDQLDLSAEPQLSGVAAEEDLAAEPAPVSLVPLRAAPARTRGQKRQDSTVRVSVEQLKQINSSFEALILNRNAVNLKLGQLQSFSELMQERMVALAAFNRQLRHWYDRASTEMVLPMGGAVGGAPRPPAASGPEAADTTAASLDLLEFDRYSQLHLLAQEHMETIVKLEEVSRDISLGLSAVGQAVTSLNYTSRDLQSRITQTQMRPFEEIVRPFPRVVRDWSVQYDKLVRLQLEGQSTLLEQFALDQLSDPLMHLLRNAFDHGVETPEERRAQQKPETATITLRAVNRGNQVVITLSDDGGGIDIERIRDRIRQYDLPEEQIAAMDQEKVLSFIFEPGFSTADKVTELSGRGFGMDVVRTNLQQLQGDIQVTTEPGQGTTFTISVPLSLSILRVMLLERQGFVFALPVDTVQEMMRTSDADTTPTHVAWQGTTLPLVHLENHWQLRSGARPLELMGKPLINNPMVMVVGEGRDSYGLSIDRFWQEQEVTIRPVMSNMPLPPGYSGTIVLGDGRVVPLVDPLRLRTWLDATPDLPETSAATEALVPAQSRTARILVVDDSIHARRYLAATLERAGYLVEQAKDGRDAVDKLTGGLQVATVICDIEMPRLDGYGVLEELRDRPEFSDLPILMLTSRSSEKHRKLAMNLGATDYFSKPYNDQALLKVLEQHTQALVAV